MDIDKVVELIRESRKCPPGHKWDKKRKSCVPKKSSRWKTVYAGWGRYDNEKDGGGSNGGNGNGGSNGGGGE